MDSHTLRYSSLMVAVTFSAKTYPSAFAKAYFTFHNEWYDTNPEKETSATILPIEML